MTINFIPNDPLAASLVPRRQIEPRRNRPSNRAGFALFDEAPEGLFEVGTPEFLFWQCREAALLSVEVWEQLNGPLAQWSAQAQDARRLGLVQDAGDDLNAFYDRRSLSFFRHTTGGHTTSSGASTDVVAHEAGHAFLDTLRPELFGGSSTEPAAFHEAFGDCVAILVALFDAQTRSALLAASPDLSAANLVEATMEDLSDGVRRGFGEANAAAAPRRALNDFQFQLPTSLPTRGRPEVLTSEVHSFGRIFSGCFYDVVRNLFNASAGRDSAALLQAAMVAGRLLIAAAKEAPVTDRFFQSVGRAMVLADGQVNGGVNRQAIGGAFARHGLLLGSSSALMPKLALAGALPSLDDPRATLGKSTLQDLRRRIGAKPRARITVAPMTLGAEPFLAAVHHRDVDLTPLDKRLAGVVAVAPEPVVIGTSGAAVAAFSALPDPTSTVDEVLKFVETLLEHERVGFGAEPQVLPTHVVRTHGQRKVLTRVRFLCGDATKQASNETPVVEAVCRHRGR